jgi:epoxyqueuosine reductase
VSASLLKDKVKAFALSLGFDDVGVASALGELPYTDQVKKAHENGRFGPLDYLSRTLDARLSLKSIFPDAETVVVVVKNYYTGDFGPEADNKAKIARYAWGKDYHQWFKKKLKAFNPFLIAQTNHPVKVWVFNDTGPFLERAWAFKSGLGFIGKSAMFIHRNWGTWTLLGGFATDLFLPPDDAYQGPDCGSCTKCIDACPTKAIVAEKTVDASKCISTWTIERPLHEKAYEQAPRHHSWGFGCDVCQEVCPWNKFQKVTNEERFSPKKGRVFFTSETFTEDLRGSPLYRSRKSGLLANYLRIKHTLTDQSLKIVLGGSAET